MPGTIAALLRCFDLCLAQSAAHAERYRELGAPRVATTGNLKLDVPEPPADADRLAALQRGDRRTHGDRRRLDPRRRGDHADRGAPSAAQRFSAACSRSSRRAIPIAGPALSRSRVPPSSRRRCARAENCRDADTDIYVADTLGELGLIYRLAPIVFVGGSLASHGGQNPIEPIKLGAAILHGPHVWNFAEIYAALDAAHGAEEMSDVGKLARAGRRLARGRGARERVGRCRGARRVAALGGALERTLAALEPYLMQIRPGSAAQPCVSRRSGGESRGSPPRAAGAVGGGLRRGRGAAARAARRGGRRAGRLHRQSRPSAAPARRRPRCASRACWRAAGERPVFLSRGYGGALAGPVRGRSGTAPRARGRRRAAAACAHGADHRGARPRRGRAAGIAARRQRHRHGRRLSESVARQGFLGAGRRRAARRRQRHASFPPVRCARRSMRSSRAPMRWSWSERR